MIPRADAGPLIAVSALIAGLLLGRQLGPDRATTLFAVGVGGLLGAWFVDGRVRAVVAAVALCVLGAALMARALDGVEHHGLRAEVTRGEAAELTGTLVSDPDHDRYRADALLRAAGADRIVVVRAGGDDAARLGALDAGDRVVVSGRLAPLPDDRFATGWRWRHAVAVLDGAEVRSFSEPDAVLMAVANRIRALASDGTRALPPEPRALVHGFMFGDTRGVPDDITDAYRAAGLSHLLAVSGANVACALALVAPILRRQSLRARTATALLVVLVFAAMTRFEPSVLRASVLATVGLLATFAGRPASRLRALALAVCALLIVDPFLVFVVGFQLSVAASIGIALFTAPIAARLWGPAFVREPLAVSLAAQVGVTPALLLIFGEVPAVTPVTNLAAGPAADALGVFALPASLLGGLVPPLAPVLAPVSALLVGWVTLVARCGAAVGVTLDRRATFVVAAAAAVATLARRARRTVPDPETR